MCLSLEYFSTPSQITFVIFDDGYVLSTCFPLTYSFHSLLFCSDLLLLLLRVPDFPLLYPLNPLLSCAYFLLLLGSPHFLVYILCNNSCVSAFPLSSFHVLSVSHYFYFTLFFAFLFFLYRISQISSIYYSIFVPLFVLLYSFSLEFSTLPLRSFCPNFLPLPNFPNIIYLLLFIVQLIFLIFVLFWVSQISSIYSSTLYHVSCFATLSL